ncbi:MAG: imidazole glycerol phosphate synthase subunit HisH [Nitrospirales bacterium]|nr:imidazole glycerol phosphate synthase subunit HisH [Nitrospira sp.]MDR4500284.1 imidazole glycerol phosphate synthase subunit HisH [Nitrospirales bacterium]
MIAIVDYGMGNLRSVAKAFETVGHQACVTRDVSKIADASHVVLPGVGAFGDCMENLRRYELIEPIRRSIASGKPFLGICLGLQLLFTESEEFGKHVGLGIFPGTVKRFPDFEKGLKIPHMGWNTVTVQQASPLLHDISFDSYVYFVHSYFVVPEDESMICTTTTYGVPFVSSVWRDNVFASQFHPEKSQKVGLQLFQNFGNWN